MTLDEYIEHFNLVVVYAKRGEEYATNFSDLDNLIDFNTGVLGYLKELKTLRVELEVYKKALEMACGQVHRFEVLLNYREGELSTDQWKEYFVKKAREE